MELYNIFQHFINILKTFTNSFNCKNNNNFICLYDKYDENNENYETIILNESENIII